jgi:hypothetical protein
MYTAYVLEKGGRALDLIWSALLNRLLPCLLQSRGHGLPPESFLQNHLSEAYEPITGVSGRTIQERRADQVDLPETQNTNQL